MLQAMKEEVFLEEYIDEAQREMDLFLEAKVKINYYFRDNLLNKYITTELAKKKTQEKIIDFTGTFIDTHHRELNTAGPVYMFTFSDKEKEFLYNLFSLDQATIMSISKNMFEVTYEISAPFHIIREAPHKLLITAILVDALQNGYKDVITCCEYILGFAEYPLMYRMFWKLDVQEDIMNYTIEHLGSKFKVTKMSNLLSLLKYDMNLSVKTWTDLLIRGDDVSYIEFIYRVRNQIKSTFKNIAREYYSNHEKQNTQYMKGGKMEDDTLANNEGITSNISTIVENTYTKFLQGINDSAVGIASDGNDVDKANLKNFINQIQTTKSNKLYKFIEDVVTVYFMENPTSTTVGSGEFFNFSLALYRSIGTSKQKLYIEIREILDFWLYNIIDISKHYPKGGTTVSNYRRAIFNYMLLMIQYHN